MEDYKNNCNNNNENEIQIMEIILIIIALIIINSDENQIIEKEYQIRDKWNNAFSCF